MPFIKHISQLEKKLIHQHDDDKKHYDLASLFHENTKYGRRKTLNDFLHFGEIRNDPETVNNFMDHFKSYPEANKTALPDISLDSLTSYEEVLIRRRSVREYGTGPISLQSLAKILILSYGITGGITYNGKVQPLRAAPSAGALFPLEIYPVIFNVEGVNPGLYHFNVREKSLELLKTGNFRNEMFSLCCDQKFILNAGVLFLITALPERTLYKYRNRGMRFIYLDAGHLAQNICLTSAGEELGACALGGFYDYEIEEFLGIDGMYETVIYALSAGTREEAGGSDEVSVNVEEKF